MLNVTWTKLTTGNWCPFETVNLQKVKTTGVYVIWHGGQKPWTVRVGQGDITTRLIAHRGDREVLAYKPYGLYVTWAAVPAQHLDGVERYLGDLLKPLVGDRFPNAWPIAVNSPWGS